MNRWCETIFFSGAALSYVEKHLIPGETIQYQTKLHWIVMLRQALIAVVLLLIGGSLLFSAWSSRRKGSDASQAALRLVGIACVGLSGFSFSFGIARRGTTEMAVTNKRVIVKTGLAERRTTEILLSRIESVIVDEPVIGRILGYGTVIVRGTGGTPEIFEKIQHPLKFREQVQSQIAGERKSN
jgi:uncharacterized membrane protein YdbT with pleckstrin-like domain